MEQIYRLTYVDGEAQLIKGHEAMAEHLGIKPSSLNVRMANAKQQWTRHVAARSGLQGALETATITKANKVPRGVHKTNTRQALQDLPPSANKLAVVRNVHDRLAND